MELNLARHGLLERRHVQEDSADSGLADEGYRQVDHVAEHLAAELTDAIYVSPMAPARGTGGRNRGPR